MATFRRQQKFGSMENELFKKWFGFLVMVNDNHKSRELMIEYFFGQFAKATPLLYKFLHFLEDRLDPSIAKKYLEILSPLCERFCFYREKNVLDDLCFKITQPKKYQKIDRLLSHYKQSSLKIMRQIIRVLSALIAKTAYDYEIKGRYKNIYSIYRKFLRKPQNVPSLKDIFAFRIILKNNSVRDCFEVLNLLHDTFLPVSEYFKDYITIPKINGYQSLHTGLAKLIPGLKLPIEVQIRTKAMDDFAEKGFAAHWLYKKDARSRLINEKESKLFGYFSTLSDSLNEMQFLYCFSYKGDMIKLKHGSAALDFAYRIHSDLGDKAVGAVVNGQKRPLKYKIHEGDCIKILQ